MPEESELPGVLGVPVEPELPGVSGVPVEPELPGVSGAVGSEPLSDGAPGMVTDTGAEA